MDNMIEATSSRASPSPDSSPSLRNKVSRHRRGSSGWPVLPKFARRLDGAALEGAAALLSTHPSHPRGHPVHPAAPPRDTSRAPLRVGHDLPAGTGPRAPTPPPPPPARRESPRGYLPVLVRPTLPLRTTTPRRASARERRGRGVLSSSRDGAGRPWCCGTAPFPLMSGSFTRCTAALYASR